MPLQCKQTCLYIGHHYHEKTLSTSFVIDFFAKSYSVDKRCIDPDSLNIREQLKRIEVERYDIVVIFQVEFILPLVWERARKVICFPMYDACGSMPDRYFEMLAGCIVVNFSSTLHIRCISAGVRSFYLKYYPSLAPIETKSKPATSINKDIRVFFWCRNDSVTLGDLERIFPPRLNYSLSLHWARDDGREISEAELDIAKRYQNYRLTHWFESKEEMIARLRECELYIAPRMAEGIGMGFLDAMANGLVVAAFDLPTHNEYIINYYNGVLFNHSSSDARIDLESINTMKRNNLQILSVGRRAFEKQLEMLAAFIDKYARDNTSPLCGGRNPFSLAHPIELVYQGGHSSFVSLITSDETSPTPRLINLIKLLKQVRDGDPMRKIELICSLSEADLKTSAIIHYASAELLKHSRYLILRNNDERDKILSLVKKFLVAVQRQNHLLDSVHPVMRLKNL